MVSVTVDKKLCIGCGACASICANVFEMKDGKSIVKVKKIEGPSCVKEAESACPVGAIKVKD